MKYLYADHSGNVTLGANSGGAIVGTLTMNDGSSNAAEIITMTQAASRLYTIPDAGGNANFVMTNSGSNQSIVSGDLIVYHNVDIGSSSITSNGHLESSGTPDAVTIDAASNATNAARIAADDIAGEISFNGITNAIPASGDQLDVQMTTPFAHTGEVPVVVVSGKDANSASLQPYAYFKTGSPNYIIIGTKIAPPATPGPAVTYTYNYQIISTQ